MIHHQEVTRALGLAGFKARCRRPLREGYTATQCGWTVGVLAWCYDPAAIRHALEGAGFVVETKPEASRDALFVTARRGRS